MLELSIEQARALHLAAQGLLTPPRRKARREDVLATIRAMGVLQIDTISVVNRSPYFVLFSRLGSYDPRWLDEALERREVFEHWAHAASFLPAEDFSLWRALMSDSTNGSARWARAQRHRNQAAVSQMLDQVRENGPVRSADFKRDDGEKAGWWNWKAEKRWLEVLFATGDLMVARRENFHRIYDVTERVAPPDPGPPHTPTSAERELTGRSLKHLGVTQARWVADYYRVGRKRTDKDLAPLVAEGIAAPVRVEGWERPAYVHRESLALAEQAAAGQLKPTCTALLSPFDPVTWDRERALALFDFDYRIECYTPAPKRQYGYFSLPILRRGALVGRLDAKAHRKEGVFEVKSLHWEPGVRQGESLERDVAGAIQRAAEWHGCGEVVGGVAGAASSRRGDLGQPGSLDFAW